MAAISSSSIEWRLKIKLTAEDVGAQRFYIILNKGAVEQHIVRHWSETMTKRATIDDIKVTMEDVDTMTEHQVNFRYYKHIDSYSLQGLWRKNFIERRALMAGDDIGLSYNPTSSKLCFSVLKRAT